MIWRFFLTACVSWFIFGAAPSWAVEIAGQPRVIDGDTLEVQGVTNRLHGIDAAETGQRCLDANRKSVHPGDNAMRLLEELAAGDITCIGSEYDDYGRLIAVCRTADGKDMEQELVIAGWAWAFVKFSSDYVPEENTARAEKRGVWNMTCEAPWEYRRRRWEVAIQVAPNGCPIKGNISSNGHIYHTPWSRDYAKTSVNVAKGERWFCSEKEALEAGWRQPRG